MNLIVETIKQKWQAYCAAMKIKRVNRQLLQCIKDAKKWKKATGKKQLVLFVDGKFRCYTKDTLQFLIRRQVFKKHTTIQDLEKLAKYITP